MLENLNTHFPRDEVIAFKNKLVLFDSHFAFKGIIVKTIDSNNRRTIEYIGNLNRPQSVESTTANTLHEVFTRSMISTEFEMNVGDIRLNL